MLAVSHDMKIQDIPFTIKLEDIVLLQFSDITVGECVCCLDSLGVEEVIYAFAVLVLRLAD